MYRTYTELSKYKTFDDRLNYLKLSGKVGVETFGYDRILNQALYASPIWKKVRRDVISRDLGFDLGIEGYDIHDKIFIHHMNPITKEDILNRSDNVYNPEFLILCSFNTHNIIHYGFANNINDTVIVERKPGDTCLWK